MKVFLNERAARQRIEIVRRALGTGRTELIVSTVGRHHPPNNFSLSITFFAISLMLTLRFWLSVCKRL